MSDHTRTRCGAQSRSVDEELQGTVPDFETFHLVPFPGPWPRAVRAVEPDGVDLPTSARLKTLYYRPYPGRPRTERPLVWDTGTRLMRAQAPDGSWRATPPTSIPQFVGVCMHGRHDTCCGVRGGGFIRRAQQLVPDAPIFGVSHLGGDRFAPTGIVLPSGYLLGRLDDLSDNDLRDLVVSGLLPLDHLRGRLGAAPAEAVAEIWYRQKFGYRDPADLPAISVLGPAAAATGPARSVGAPSHEVLVDDGLRSWRLELRREQREGAAIQHTCQAALSKPVFHWHIDVVEETVPALAAV